MPKDKPAKKSTTLRHNPLAEQTTAVHGKLSKPKHSGARNNAGGHPNRGGGTKKVSAGEDDDEDAMDDWEEETAIPSNIGAKIFMQAREQAREDEMADTGFGSAASLLKKASTLSTSQPSAASRRVASAEVDEDEDGNWDDMDEDDEENIEEEDDEQFVELDGDEVRGTGLSESEEVVVQRFLQAGK